MIAVNIGDALMRWSGDRLKSNFHRVRMPTPQEDQSSRYSIAYFNQVKSDFTASSVAPQIFLFCPTLPMQSEVVVSSD